MTDTNLLAPFEPIQAMMTEYKKENESLVFDYRDPEGNKAARSHVHKLRGVKTKIADVHKQAKAEALEVCRKIDGFKNLLTGQVEEMIAVHNEPLVQIEQEQAKAEAEKQRLIKEAADKAEAARLAEIERREAELRAREEALLVAVQKKEAEECACREEAERIEREKRIAEDARAKAEVQAKEALEAAERRRLADIEAERQRLIAQQKAKELAERKQQEAQEQADRKRQEDKKHRAKVRVDIVGRLVEIGIETELAERLFDAINKGTVPYVKIEY